MNGNSLVPKINGKKTVTGAVSISALGLLAYMIMQNASAIEVNAAKNKVVVATQQTYAADAKETKKDVRHIRETMILVCEKLDIKRCRR